HVRFTPNSDRESGLPKTVMSALPPKADMCGALGHVCYAPRSVERTDLHKQKDRLTAVSPKSNQRFDRAAGVPPSVCGQSDRCLCLPESLWLLPSNGQTSTTSLRSFLCWPLQETQICHRAV